MQDDLFGARPPEPLHRLFFAFVPDARGLAALAPLIDALRPLLPNARWVRASRQHMTLLYLGESAGRREDWVVRACQAMEGWQAPSFEVEFDHLRALGNPRRPALACTARHVSIELQAVWAELQQRMRLAGFRGPHGNALLAHLTVAYTDPGPPLPAVPAVRLRADAVRLLLSIEGKAEHECLREWPLVAGWPAMGADAV